MRSWASKRAVWARRAAQSRRVDRVHGWPGRHDRVLGQRVGQPGSDRWLTGHHGVALRRGPVHLRLGLYVIDSWQDVLVPRLERCHVIAPLVTVREEPTGPRTSIRPRWRRV